jgi:pyruvate,water dikinase
MGAKAQQILDNIQAYFYFPLAIAKAGFLSEGTIGARVRAEAGLIDQAGGIAFGIQNIGNYFVFRLNSLEDNLILFEYVNNRRLERRSAARRLEAGRWYRLEVAIAGRRVTAGIDGETALTYDAERNLTGHVGLWTKADSVARFDDFGLETAGARKDLMEDLRRIA